MGWTSVIPASTPRHSCEGRNPQGCGEVYAPTFEHHSGIMVQPSDFLERCDKLMILARMLCYIMAHAIYDVE